MDYFYIDSHTDKTIGYDGNWDSAKKSQLRCRHPECGDWNPDLTGIDIVVVDFPPDVMAYRHFSFCNVGIRCIHDELIQRVGGNLIESAFYLGKILDMKGDCFPGWRTLRPRRKLILRGSKPRRGKFVQKYWRCPVCSNLKYFPLVKPYYALSQDLEGVSLITSNVHFLIMTRAIYERISELEFPETTVGRLVVRKEPIDGWAVDI